MTRRQRSIDVHNYRAERLKTMKNQSADFPSHKTEQHEERECEILFESESRRISTVTFASVRSKPGNRRKKSSTATNISIVQAELHNDEFKHVIKPRF